MKRLVDEISADVIGYGFALANELGIDALEMAAPMAPGSQECW